MFTVLYRFWSKQSSEWSRFWLWKLVSMVLEFVHQLYFYILIRFFFVFRRFWALLASIYKYITCFFSSWCSKIQSLIVLVSLGTLHFFFFKLDASHDIHLGCWLCINPLCINNMYNHFCWCIDALEVCFFFFFLQKYNLCHSSLSAPCCCYPVSFLLLLLLVFHHHCSISILNQRGLFCAQR